jgi:hypothetical protein
LAGYVFGILLFWRVGLGKKQDGGENVVVMVMVVGMGWWKAMKGSRLWGGTGIVKL